MEGVDDCPPLPLLLRESLPSAIVTVRSEKKLHIHIYTQYVAFLCVIPATESGNTPEDFQRRCSVSPLESPGRCHPLAGLSTTLEVASAAALLQLGTAGLCEVWSLFSRGAPSPPRAPSLSYRWLFQPPAPPPPPPVCADPAAPCVRGILYSPVFPRGLRCSLEFPSPPPPPPS